MSRVLRFQYPEAVYHVMVRGDGGRTVFENKDDCEVFLHRLGMGLPGSVSRMLGEVKKNRKLRKKLDELGKM